MCGNAFRQLQLNQFKFSATKVVSVVFGMKLQQGVGVVLVLVGLYVALFQLPNSTAGTMSIVVSGFTLNGLSLRQIESISLGAFFVLVGASLLKRV